MDLDENFTQVVDMNAWGFYRKWSKLVDFWQTDYFFSWQFSQIILSPQSLETFSLNLKLFLAFQMVSWSHKRGDDEGKLTSLDGNNQCDDQYHDNWIQPHKNKNVCPFQHLKVVDPLTWLISNCNITQDAKSNIQHTCIVKNQGGLNIMKHLQMPWNWY